MRSVLIAVSVAALALALAAAALSLRTAAYTPYPLIDPDRIFSGLPGSPKKSRDATSELDALGYVVAGDARAVAVMSSKRPGNPNDLYDVDLSVRVLVLPTAEKARHVFGVEQQQDRKLVAARVDLAVPQRLEAEEVVAWSMGKANPMLVVQARYGNYVVRYVGKVAQGGYFGSEAAFFQALRVMDSHVKNSLGSAATRSTGPATAVNGGVA